MTNDNHRDLTPVLPKKERGNFFILLLFLLLLPANLALFLRIPDHFRDYQHSFILSNGTEIFFDEILLVLSILLCIVGIYTKSYRMLASTACLLLITTYLGHIFEGPFHNVDLIITLTSCAIILLIPAINARICQLGAIKTANRRLSFAYLFFIPAFFAFSGLFALIDRYEPTDYAVAYRMVSIIFCPLTIILWISSLKKNIWINTSTEKEISTQSWRSRVKAMALLVAHMMILIILFGSFLYITNDLDGKLRIIIDGKTQVSYEFKIILTVLLCLGLFIASYWSKKTRVSRILLGIGILASSMTLIALTIICKEFIPHCALSENILILLILINALFAPLCLASCRGALLTNPSPQNKAWVFLLLLLNFLIAFCLTFILRDSI